MTWNIVIDNIAGIRSGEVTLTPGANVIQASNWQGKTSLMTAVRAVLGGKIDASSVTKGESEGHVTLTETTGDNQTREYSVDIKPRAGGIRAGEPYISKGKDRVCADLFAFLDERNEIRAAVREGADLTPLLTRPFDQMDIKEQINNLKTERREVESELERVERAASRLPAKQEELTQTRGELDELRDQLDQPEGTSDKDGQQEALREDLKEKRTARERVQQSINRLQRQIETSEEELAETKEELEEVNVPEIPDLETDLDQARDRLSTVDSGINTLNDLYNVNMQILDRDHLDLVTTVERQLDDDHLTCWVCGESTARQEIEERLDVLGQKISSRRESAEELRNEVEELEETKNEIQNQRRRRDRLQSQIATLETRLEERQSELEANEQRLEELTAKVNSLESRVKETDDRRSTLEREIARKEAACNRLEEEIEELETQANHADGLEDRRAELTEEIEDLRMRRERITARAQEAFDAALEDVLEAFGPSFQAARLDKHTNPETGETERIELILAREGREISVNELSEGETELVGFITALAGYEAFDVADRVPCMLVDDVGGLASEHLHTLVAYLSDRAEYVVTSAYPEAGEFDGQTISPDAWDVVSDHAGSVA